MARGIDYGMDKFTAGHFETFVRLQQISEEGQEAMLEAYRNDPEHWERSGWAALADAVSAWGM